MAKAKQALVDEILEKKLKAEKHYQVRNDNMVKWRRLWMLDLFDASEPDKNLVTPPDFFNIVEMTRALTMSRLPTITVPMIPEEGKKSDDIENRNQDIEDLLYCVLFNTDLPRVLSQAVAYSSGMSMGWIHGPIWRETSKRRPFPLFYEWIDPTTIYPDPGSSYEDPNWIIHAYPVPRGEAISKYNVKLPDKSNPYNRDTDDEDEVDLVDYWYWADDNTVEHAVLVEEELVQGPNDKNKRTATEEGYEFLPFTGWPGIDMPFAEPEMKALPTFWPAINAVKLMAVVLSQRQLITQRLAMPNLLVKSDFVDPNNRTLFVFDPEPGSTNFMRTDEDAKYVEPPKTSIDIDKQVSVHKSNIEDSTYPAALSGRFETSNVTGVATMARLNPSYSRISGRQSGIESAIERIFRNTLIMMRKHVGSKGLEMSGRSAKGRSILVKVTKDMLKETPPRIDVKLSNSMPRDMMAEISAIMPLLQAKTIPVSVVMDFVQQFEQFPEQSPERWKQEILADEMERNPDVLKSMAQLSFNAMQARFLIWLRDHGIDIKQLKPEPKVEEAQGPVEPKPQLPSGMPPEALLDQAMGGGMQPGGQIPPELAAQMGMGMAGMSPGMPTNEMAGEARDQFNLMNQSNPMPGGMGGV